MAEKLNDAFFSLGGTELSSKVKTIRLPESVEALDDTTMGDGTKSNLAGLKDWSLEVDFVQGYGAGEVDTVIAAAGGIGTIVAFVVRKSSDAVGSANPSWSGTGLIQEYQPVGGDVGGLHMTRLKLVPAGASNALTRATA